MNTTPLRQPQTPVSRPVARVINALSTLEGGGFPVRRPFPIQGFSHFDPFLLVDHLGPVEWKPGAAIGAPDHPHRGFETVTYVLAGENEHRDSFGNADVLKPGDVLEAEESLREVELEGIGRLRNTCRVVGKESA